MDYIFNLLTYSGYSHVTEPTTEQAAAAKALNDAYAVEEDIIECINGDDFSTTYPTLASIPLA